MYFFGRDLLATINISSKSNIKSGSTKAISRICPT
jgi:hypothetical protein